jgi:hypothetical protein
MKCGCELGFNHEANVGDEDFIDAENCLLPEGVAIIREFLLSAHILAEPETWTRAKAYVAKVEGSGKVGDEK